MTSATPPVPGPSSTPTPPSGQVGHDVALAQLANFVTMAAKQDQVVWSIFGVFAAANAILVVALFDGGSSAPVGKGLTISIIGFLLSLIWFLVQSRTIAHLDFYETALHHVEERLIPDTDRGMAVSGQLNPLYRQRVGGFRARPVIRIISVVSAATWLFAAGYFISCRTA